MASLDGRCNMIEFQEFFWKFVIADITIHGDQHRVLEQNINARADPSSLYVDP
jgi:hypothetical protein